MLKHRFRRHRTISSLLREFEKGEMEVTDPVIARETIEDEGMWAFVRIPLGRRARTEPAVVHWWAQPGQPDDQVALMLGHELGHISGEILDDGDAEEERADAYGEVAREVFLKLSRLGRPSRRGRSGSRR